MNKLMKKVLPANELCDQEAYIPGLITGSEVVLSANGECITMRVNNQVEAVAARYGRANDIVAINKLVASILDVDFCGDEVECTLHSLENL